MVYEAYLRKCEKYSINWILTIFYLSDPTKISFSSKLEVMRISPEKISTKKIKIKKVRLT